MNRYPDFEPSGFGKTIFLTRYALTQTETWAEMAARCGYHVAQAESGDSIAKYRDIFSEMIRKCLFIPGGRTLSGSGLAKGNLLNCNVVPVSDSREGWGKVVSDIIVISGTGGGVGVNYSPVRPRGSKVGENGIATGSVSLMTGINAFAGVIKAGGGRRSALMMALAHDHGDIREFLDAKLDLDQLNNANISVIFEKDPEIFFDKVRKGEDLELKFGSRVVGKIPAAELWHRLVSNAITCGEPGILNGWYANRMSNSSYCAPLVSTNPCVTGDTMVMTDAGPRTARSLVGRRFVTIIDGQRHSSDARGFWPTGVKPVFKLQTSRGFTLTATENHKILTVDGWKEVKDLKPGVKVVLSENNTDHPDGLRWSAHPQSPLNPKGYGAGFDEGWLLGEIVGDGGYNPDKYHAYLRFWGPSRHETAKLATDIVRKMEGVRGDFAGRVGHVSTTVQAKALDGLCLPFIVAGTKEFLPELETETSSDFVRGFLRGLFDADGTVAVNRKGSSVRLSQSSLAKLVVVQRMLARFGILSTLYKGRKPAGVKLMPNGKGGYATYPVQETHELVITRDCIELFGKHIGFYEPDKSLKLRSIITGRLRRPYKSSYTSTITAIEPLGSEEVYDCCVPNINAFDGNGIIAHNCGEVFLSSYESCCLGSLVLPHFVQNNGKLDWDSMKQVVTHSIRFLDDVLSVNKYPLPEVQAASMDLRRIGLGVMGLHDMMLLMGYRYGSVESLEFLDHLFDKIKTWAYEASIALAQEKGAFAKFNPDLYCKSGFIKTLKPSLREKIRLHGIRNVAVLTIAPTGTTSILAGCSGGIEPIFAPAYLRRFMQGESQAEEIVVHPLFQKMFEAGQDVSVFGCASDITPREHLEVQAICQKHVDNAISKTINAPASMTEQELSDLYMEYFPVLKGITVYVDGSRGGQPLTPYTVEEAIALVQAGVGVSGSAENSCKGGKCDI